MLSMNEFTSHTILVVLISDSSSQSGSLTRVLAIPSEISALTDHPDGIWYLINDDQKNRYCSAIGRDIEIVEGEIIYDKITSELSFAGAGKRATKDLTSRQRILEFIKANPGSNASDINESIGRDHENLRL